MDSLGQAIKNNMPVGFVLCHESENRWTIEGPNMDLKAASTIEQLFRILNEEEQTMRLDIHD